MNKLLITALFFSASVANAASGLTPNQEAQLCKITDPVFISKVPLLLELKAEGKLTARQATIVFMEAYTTYSTNGGFEYAKAIKPIFESSARTPDEALAAAEAKCAEKLRGL